MKRVVTGIGADGRDAILQESEISPVAGLPGSTNQTRLCWASPDQISLPFGAADPVTQLMSMPGPGETRFIFVTFAPNSATPLHATPTLDYVAVVFGELWLVMEDGSECRIGVGDAVVQNGTRHIWENRSAEPCTIAATMIGASKSVPAVDTNSDGHR